MVEEWRPVVGYEGFYEVSNTGYVRSLWRRFKHVDILKLRYHKCGYPVVFLRRPGLPGRLPFVHTLVLEAFVGPRPDGMEARHLDGDRKNPSLANLMWDTRLENAADKLDHGTSIRGSSIGTSKLTEEQVAWLLTQTHRTGASIARELGVSATTVQRIRKGDGWLHVSREVASAD